MTDLDGLTVTEEYTRIEGWNRERTEKLTKERPGVENSAEHHLKCDVPPVGWHCTRGQGPRRSVCRR